MSRGPGEPIPLAGASACGYPEPMDVHGELFAQIMRLPERERLALLEDVMAATIDAAPGPTGLDELDRAALLDALEQSARDVEAGRTRSAADVLAKHWPR